ncbi:hypothetical protein [Kitasatospora sp. McL0602]|uniref:hypothetical protein n=1 Tax=Kitasatospora sp. McL0602 TaxID=3439530 RepID=UPI003F89F24A
MSQDANQGATAAGGTSSSVSHSTVNGPLVQLGRMHGDIHFHGRPRTPRAPGPETVEVLVERRDPVGRYVVLPSLDALADPPVRGPGVLVGGEDIAGWARSHGGVDFDSTVLFVTLTNRSDSHLTLRGISAVVLRRTAPTTGALIGKQTAGSQPVPELLFDLDQAEPELWEVDEQSRQPIGARPYLDRTHVRLAPDESLKLIITAESRRTCCTWQLSLTFRPDDAPEFTVRPPDEFRTTGLPVEGLGPVLVWQWHRTPPQFEHGLAYLDWCRVGNSEPRPLGPLPPGVLPPFWARHPNVLPFLPALIHFLSTDTTGPEARHRLEAAFAAVDAARSLAGSGDKAFESLAEPLRKLAPALLTLCAGLAAGQLPAGIHDTLRSYIERTPAAIALTPAFATITRLG